MKNITITKLTENSENIFVNIQCDKESYKQLKYDLLPQLGKPGYKIKFNDENNQLTTTHVNEKMMFNLIFLILERYNFNINYIDKNGNKLSYKVDHDSSIVYDIRDKKNMLYYNVFSKSFYDIYLKNDIDRFLESIKNMDENYNKIIIIRNLISLGITKNIEKINNYPYFEQYINKFGSNDFNEILENISCWYYINNNYIEPFLNFHNYIEKLDNTNFETETLLSIYEDTLLKDTNMDKKDISYIFEDFLKTIHSKKKIYH